jgi:hypothetical protein
VNTGFERDGVASLSEKMAGNWTPKDLSTFCPKAIAGIGHLPTTISDRAIAIELERQPKTQSVELLKKRKVLPEGTALQRFACGAEW